MQHSLQEVLGELDFCKHSNPYTAKVLTAIKHCRTSHLGYHYYRCENPDCCHVHYQYHSCRNRHCPQCNGMKQDEWKEARMNELLPVKYFHVVFTLPHELNSLVMGNRAKLFKLLFDGASFTLLKLSSDPQWLGAMPSITAVLHTWGQKLSFHPHLHCIVSGGGVDKDNNWIELKKKSHQGFLFPYPVMEPLFKAYFLRNLHHMIGNDEIRIADKNQWLKLKDSLYRKQWIVYAKSPMGSVSQVVEYLARYSHKVAIANHRILEVSKGYVKFSYRDYADNNKTKNISLTSTEFIRRFEQHILPKGFVKMRHYGILGNFKRKQRINEILKKMKLPLHPPQVKIPYQIRMLERFGRDITLCPKCSIGHLILLEKVFPKNRGSPQNYPWAMRLPSLK